MKVFLVIAFIALVSAAPLVELDEEEKRSKYIIHSISHRTKLLDVLISTLSTSVFCYYSTSIVYKDYKKIEICIYVYSNSARVVSLCYRYPEFCW